MALHFFAALPLVASAALLLSGCYGMGDYRGAEEGKQAIDPRSVEVDSSKFPRYHVVSRLTPPLRSKLPSEEEFLARNEEHRERLKKGGWRPARGQPDLSENVYRAIDRGRYLDLRITAQPVEILPSDEWVVTHVVGQIYYVHSASFQERECRRIAERALVQKGPQQSIRSALDISGIARNAYPEKCLYEYTYHVPIHADGTVAGRWKLIRDNDFAFNRRTVMDVDPADAIEWGVQPTFKPTKNGK